MNKLVTFAQDAGTVLLVGMSLPFLIILLGMPLVLVVRLLLEIVRWLVG